MKPFQRIHTTCLACTLFLLFLFPSALAATGSLHIVKYAADGETVLNETDVTCGWMEENLPVFGDGVTHYYLQGPVFVDDPDPGKEEMLRWNPAEDVNVREKDLGAVRGTGVKDLCELVGGMRQGDILTIKAVDGFKREFPYRNVYEPTTRQGPMVISWWTKDEGYVPAYTQGMRLVFFADNSTNPWGLHAMGAWDWHESAEGQYWYYYRQGEEKYPTTTGLSVQYVSALQIKPGNTTLPARDGTEPPRTTGMVEEPLSLFAGIVAIVTISGLEHARRKTK